VTIKPAAALLILFRSSDGLELPGLLFEPQKRTRRVALFLHGNGDASIFYQRRTNSLAEILTRAGIAWFPFNNRGAHLIKQLNQHRAVKWRSIKAGMAYELIRDCVKDIDGAIDALQRLGYTEFYLVGHSTGANKICLYDALARRRRAHGYVLLAPGDDVGIYYAALGARRFGTLLDRCRERIAEGRGSELAPRSASPFPISFRSLYDTINPNGSYNIFPFYELLTGTRIATRRRPLREFRSLHRPVCVILGSEDQYCFGDPRACLEILRANAPRSADFVLLEGANHAFHGREAELGDAIVGAITRARRRAGRTRRRP
jgi:pimeloyl-ACP methyl ester carboxylesterase